jgi:hypothetical protein
VIHYFEISIHIENTQCYIPEDGSIHEYCCESPKFYIGNTFQKHNLFPPSHERQKTLTLLGPLERANINSMGV